MPKVLKNMIKNMSEWFVENRELLSKLQFGFERVIH